MVNVESFVVALALTADALFGDPRWLYARVPHPIVWMGTLIGKVEHWANRRHDTGPLGRVTGVVCVSVLVALAVISGWALQTWLVSYDLGWVACALIASTLIAFRGLYDHVLAVARALEVSLADGREAVSHIVGRDPQVLDQSGVCRGAIESAAENFSDGVVVPVFWFVLFGLPGLLGYKMINTLDSMWGHRNVRYRHFGWAAARVDDAVNWLPARLAGCLFVLGAIFLPGASARDAWRCMVRDAPKHRSPNAGWQEAAVAGALGIAVAGPRQYAGEMVADAWMGDGRRQLGPDDIHRTLRLYLMAGGVLFAAVVVMALVRTPVVA